MTHLVAANIPDGLIFGIVPTILGVVFAWGAWLTLQSTRTESQAAANTERLDRHNEKLDDHEIRLRQIERQR